MVQDHEHLRSLLAPCEPENRSAMYDSLKPYLRFTPKPLDGVSDFSERYARARRPTSSAAQVVEIADTVREGKKVRISQKDGVTEEHRWIARARGKRISLTRNMAPLLPMRSTPGEAHPARLNRK